MNMTEPRKDVWADLQAGAKGFYGDCEAVHRKSSLDVLRELDPPDPAGDGALVTQWEEKLKRQCRADVTSPVMAQKIREWAEGRATLNRYLAKAVGNTGIHSLATVKDFYTDTGVTALFPAYIEARIQQALLANSLVNELIFADEPVTSTKVVALYVTDSATDRSLRIVAEGAELPVTDIATADSTIALGKFGRQIRATYEAVADQRVDAFGNMLGKIGRQIGIDETDRILHIAIAGDGTTAGAAETNSTDTDVASSGTITFSDMLTWYYACSSTTTQNAYQLDKAIGGKTDLALIANLAEFSDVQYIAGQGSVKIPTPVALQYLLWNGGLTGSSYVDRLVIGIDSRNAFLGYTHGSFIQEADKLIDRQINRSTFAYWRGFRKWDTTAVQVLDCAAAL